MGYMAKSSTPWMDRAPDKHDQNEFYSTRGAVHALPRPVALTTTAPSPAISGSSSKLCTVLRINSTPLPKSSDFIQGRYTAGFTETVSNVTPAFAVGGRACLGISLNWSSAENQQYASMDFAVRLPTFRTTSLYHIFDRASSLV